MTGMSLQDAHYKVTGRGDTFSILVVFPCSQYLIKMS